MRDVHYRNQSVKVLENLPGAIIIQIGYCAEKDFPLQVIKVPK